METLNLTSTSGIRAQNTQVQEQGLDLARPQILRGLGKGFFCGGRGRGRGARAAGRKSRGSCRRSQGLRPAAANLKSSAKP